MSVRVMVGSDSDGTGAAPSLCDAGTVKQMLTSKSGVKGMLA